MPNSKRKTVYVEFTGPMGSGKTTVCKEIVKHLMLAGHKIETRNSIKKSIDSCGQEKKYLIKIALWLLKNFIFCLKVLLISIKINWYIKKRNLTLPLFKDMISTRYKLDKNPDITISDQGIIHRIIYADQLAQSRVPENFIRYFFYLAFCDIKNIMVVFINIDIEKASRRVLRRRKSSESILSEIENRRASFKSRKKSEKRIKNILNQFNVNNVYLDGNKPISKNANILRKNIKICLIKKFM